ncbi:thiolase C-terminal domain-containing protein, partial [Streptomyces noursei]
TGEMDTTLPALPDPVLLQALPLAMYIDVAILYDHFTPFVLMQLEEFGFCGRGEAADFVAADALPLNTHGGQLGEAYLHGMNGIAEAVRQLRGSSVNQAGTPAHVLVTAGTGVPTSGLVLGRAG